MRPPNDDEPVAYDRKKIMHRCIRAMPMPSSTPPDYVISACGEHLEDETVHNSTRMQLLAAKMRGHLCMKCFDENCKPRKGASAL